MTLYVSGGEGPLVRQGDIDEMDAFFNAGYIAAVVAERADLAEVLLIKRVFRNHRIVGVFPNPAALLRLAGSVLIEQHDEWEAGNLRYVSEASMFELTVMNATTDTPEEVNCLPEFSAAGTETTDLHDVEIGPPPIGICPSQGSGFVRVTSASV